jgi:hypothetical protein
MPEEVTVVSQSLAVELSDEVYAAIQRQAVAAGTSPAHLAAASLAQRFGETGLVRTAAEQEAARRRFEYHIGEVDLGYPTGADNEGIDADLGKEFADTHKEV